MTVTVLVVPEKVSKLGDPPRYAYHLPAGPWDRDAVWQPIRCGDGIISPWSERRPDSDVCPDCKAAP